jgi:hypothetical protein
MKHGSQMGLHGVVGALVGALFVGLAACGDDAGTGGTAGDDAGGAPSNGGAGGAPSNGGAGGAPSTGGAPSSGGGGAGGGPARCLDLGDAPFSVEGDDLCLVRVVDAPGLSLAAYGATPTWGRHDGLLTLATRGASLTRTRWSLDGDLLVGAEDPSVTIADLPGDAFWGGLTVDSDVAAEYSVAGWSGQDFFNDGELVGFGAAAVQVSRGNATGVFGVVTVGQRVLYTGLSPVGGPAEGRPGLYAAELASAASGFEGSTLVDEFGQATGPLALDADGRLFAIMTNFGDGTQEVRTYAAADVDSASPPVVGASFATLDGYGDALAALAPTASAPGLLVFQPNDAAGPHQPVVLWRYAADGAPEGATPSAWFTPDAPDTNVTLTSDDDGQLWVGIDGGATSTLYVFARP